MRTSSRMLAATLTLAAIGSTHCASAKRASPRSTDTMRVIANRQLTTAASSHVLTNINAFSRDSNWLVYDVRSSGGDHFDGPRIEQVRLSDGHVDVIYTGTDGANVGVATFNPAADEVAFILGPAHPTPDFSYSASRRQGVIVDCNTKQVRNLDARSLTPPFTAGALRGGTHVHVFNAAGALVSSTYEDDVLDQLGTSGVHDINQRTIAVSVLNHPVHVDQSGPHDHDGSAYTVVVARTTNTPTPGSDEINRAFEEGWIGTNGYVRADGSRQKHALAFQGNVVTADGKTISEVYVVDLPDDLTKPSDGPLQGTSTTRPLPPAGCVQRRLTHTTDRAFPGIQGPRHWLRASPDGSAIAFLMKDDAGVVQLWTISPNGGERRQLTRNAEPISSAFTWSPDGNWITHTLADCLCVTNASTGETTRLTEPLDATLAPKPQACVFSPDGKHIAYVRVTADAKGTMWDQVWLVDLAK